MAVDLAAAFERAPNAYMVLDREYRYVAANAAYLAVTARRREDLIGRYLFDEFPHDPFDPANESVRRLRESLDRVVSTGQPDVLPVIHYRIAVDGVLEDHYWSATHTPLFDAQGRVEYILQNTQDVTELHKRAHASELAGVLVRAEQVAERNRVLDADVRRMLHVFEQAPGFLAFLAGPDHVFELANTAYIRLIDGRDPIGKPIRAALPEVGAEYFALLDRVFATGEPFVGVAMPVTLQRGPGQVSQVFVDFIYQPIRDARGAVVGILVQGQDVTRQTHAEHERTRALAELEAIFESFPEAVYVGDASGIRRTNAAGRRILGLSATDDVTRPIEDMHRLVRPRNADTREPLATAESPFARALRGEETRQELLFATNDPAAAERYIYASSAPIVLGGEIAGAVVTHLDITAQRRARTEIAQLARVLDVAREFIGIARLDGQPTFVNAAGRELVGLASLEAALAVPLVEYFVPAERARVRDEVIPTALRTGYWEGELHFLHHGGRGPIPVLYSVFPLRDATGEPTAMATITRDLRPLKARDDERRQLLAAEQAARVQAERASRSKDEFLATISHELRTPLNAILGWMQMLRGGLVGAEQRERALETVERNARVQAKLIDDLLDVSRIVSGKLALDLAQVEVTSIVAAAVETVRPSAEQKGVRLDVHIESTAPVIGDARRLQQVVWNLLSNAVKFTPEGGRIELRVERSEDMLELSVTDTGLGIDRELLPFVFDRWRQGDHGSGIGGLGLGLSIVKHIVDAHRGEVRATSEGPGRGARFRVSLPVTRATSTLVEVEPLPLSIDRSLAGIHVLLVEDDGDARDWLAMLLQRCGVRVTTARSVGEAMAAFRRDVPDLLLSDIGLPDGDGFHLIEQVRALPAASGGGIPAVAVTAFARPEDRTRALVSGFQNHLAKPVSPAELVAVLGSLVRRPTA